MTLFECDQCGNQKKSEDSGARTRLPCKPCGAVRSFERIEDERQVKCCPECDSSRIGPRSDRNSRVAADWYCRGCQTHFDDPATTRQAKEQEIGGSEYARILRDTDPDEFDKILESNRTDWIADCRHCDYISEYPNKTKARQYGNLHANNSSGNHDAVVYAAVDADTRLFYASKQSSRRLLHLDPDCHPLKDTSQTSDCPASHPPRGRMCPVCAPSLTVDDLPTAIAADGGEPDA